MRQRCVRLAAAVGVWMGLAAAACAITISGYTATVNERFSSGFPTAPVPNTAGTFVGLPYDWSGVAWSTTTYAASSYKGFGMLSPRHFLAAQHYENGSDLTLGVRLRGNDGSVSSQTNSGISNLGYGIVLTGRGVTAPDLAIGRLAAPIAPPSAFARYGVLDLFSTSSSTTYSVYDGLSLLAYGRGGSTNASPRVGATSVFAAQLASGTDPTTPVILTQRTGVATVQLVGGDSGSPLLHGWTNPDDKAELTVLGVNSAFTNDNTLNIMSLLAAPGAMANANAVMNPDGFALRIVGNPSATWVGGDGNGQQPSHLNRGGNWTGASVPSDLYSAFNAATTSVRSITVNAATNLRGLAFLSTATAADGFTLSGASTLSIGRGGITNYDDSRQTISAPITLGASQYWDVGSEGVTAGAIATAGFLLEVAGSGTGIISGVVSGTGGVALSGSRLEMSGTSNYTGGTWVHAGSLVVNGSITDSSGVTVNAGGALAGSGRVAAIAGSGSVDPGNSPGILTAPSVNPVGGLDFNLEFTKLGSPTWGTATASGNDVLRLQSATTPFTASLTGGNTINIYLDVASLGAGNTFRGGFFTDQDADFLASIVNASFNYFLAAEGGSVSYGGKTYNPYTGPYTFDWSTVVEAAPFAGGVETGYVSQFVFVPEPGTFGLLVVAAVGGLVAARRRR